MTNSKLQNVISKIQAEPKAITIVVGNQKGGVGKTTNTYLIGYTLAKMGLNVLVADLDPQANATKVLWLTKNREAKELETIDKTLMFGVQEGNLTNLPVKIMDNLSLLPSYIDFQGFTKYVYTHTNGDGYQESHILQPLFEPLKSDYDIILVDTPPFSKEVTDNAIMFSDYALISLQTQDDSLTGAEEYVNTLVTLNEKFNVNLEIIGVLPVLSDSRSGVDQTVLNAAQTEFGDENVFKTVVPQMARVKRFSLNGITDRDRFDHRVTDLYQKVTDEVLERLALLRGIK